MEAQIRPRSTARQESMWRFLRHLLEMIVVMMLGMCVLGVTWGAFHEIVFGSALARRLAGGSTSGSQPSRWPST